jgi:ribosomal protein S20
MENNQKDSTLKTIERTATGLITSGIDLEEIREAFRVVDSKLEAIKEEQYKHAVNWARNMAKNGEREEFIEELTRVNRSEFIDYIDLEARKKLQEKYGYSGPVVLPPSVVIKKRSNRKTAKDKLEAELAYDKLVEIFESSK